MNDDLLVIAIYRHEATGGWDRELDSLLQLECLIHLCISANNLVSSTAICKHPRVTLQRVAADIIVNGLEFLSQQPISQKWVLLLDSDMWIDQTQFGNIFQGIRSNEATSYCLIVQDVLDDGCEIYSCEERLWQTSALIKWLSDSNGNLPRAKQKSDRIEARLNVVARRVTHTRKPINLEKCDHLAARYVQTELESNSFQPSQFSGSEAVIHDEKTSVREDELCEQITKAWLVELEAFVPKIYHAFYADGNAKDGGIVGSRLLEVCRDRFAFQPKILAMVVEQDVRRGNPNLALKSLSKIVSLLTSECMDYSNYINSNYLLRNSYLLIRSLSRDNDFLYGQIARNCNFAWPRIDPQFTVYVEGRSLWIERAAYSKLMKIASESGFIPDTFPNVTTINAFANEGISPTEVGWWSNTEELQLNLLDARRLGTLLSSKVLDRIPAIYEGSLATSQVPFSQLEFGTRLKDVAEKCAIWIGEGPVLIKVRFGCRYVEMLRL